MEFKKVAAFKFLNVGSYIAAVLGDFSLRQFSENKMDGRCTLTK